MDFHGMKRKELQSLCRKNGIPANLKNSEMADRLATVFKEKESEESVLGKEISSEGSFENDSLKENLVESKETKKVTFSPENEVFEFTRSVKKRRRRNGTRSESSAQDFQDGGKVVRRSKRNVAKGMSGDGSTMVNENESHTRREPEVTETVPSRSTLDVTEDHKVLRRSKRIACNDSIKNGAVGIHVDKLYAEGQGPVIEQPPVRSSSQHCSEEANYSMVSKQFADKDIAKGLSLGIKVDELEMEVNEQACSKIEKSRRQSTRITANVKESYMVGETQEVETFVSAKDSKEERKARRSRRLAASNNAEGEPIENNMKEPLVECEVQTTEKQPGGNILDVSEAERIPRRSKRIRDDVSAAPEINNSQLILVDGNTRTGVQGGPEVEKASRRSKRFEANDGSQGEAPKINVNEFHIDGQAQKSEQQPKNSFGNDFHDRKLLKQSKRIAVDDNTQVGAPNLNDSDHHVNDQNQMTREQHKKFTDDGPELAKVVRRSKRLAANEDEQIGAPGINAERDLEGKSQAAGQRTRKCTQVGLRAGNNLRRSKRCTARYDKRAGASLDDVKNPHMNDEIQVPMRSMRNSRHNLRKALKVVEENLVGKKTDEALGCLAKSPTKAVGKKKRDTSGIQMMDTEVVSSQSSLTVEERLTEYAQLEPEAAEICKGTEGSCTKVTARSFSKKRKIVDQECIKDKLQRFVEDSPSLSVAEAIEPVLSTEDILDPQSDKSAGASEGMDSQQLSSVRMTRENEQDSLIQAEMNKDTENTSFLFQFPSKGLLVGENDNTSGVQSEVKTCIINSRIDGYLFEETSRQTALVQSVERKVEAEIDVHSAHILAKNIASTPLKEDNETKKKTSVPTLEFDLNESSGVPEAAGLQVISEKLPSDIMKDSVGCWKEFHSSKDDDKGFLEKNTRTASLHENFSEYKTQNSSSEEQTDTKIGCDMSGGKISSETTIVPITNTLEAKAVSMKEEAIDVTSVKYSDVTDSDSESMRSSLVKQTNLLVMDVGPESAPEAYCIESVSHGNAAQTAEGQDTTNLIMAIGKDTENFKERMPESMTKHHGCTETSVHEIEETDLLAKVAGSITCEEIQDTLLTSDKTKEMAATEVVPVSSMNKKREEDSQDKDAEVALNLRNSEVLTDEEGNKATSGKVNFGHGENLETLAKVKDDNLKKFEETNCSGRGYKQEVMDLSRLPSTDLDSLAPKEEEAPKLLEEERSHNESFIVIFPEKKMLRKQLKETGKSFAAEMVTQYNDEAVESPDERVVFSSPEEHLLLGDPGLGEAGNERENKASKFHDESNIFTTPQRHLMLGGSGLNEGGNEGENTAAKFHDDPVVATSPDRHLSSGDSKQDGGRKNEENKDVQFHGISVVFTTPERHLLLGDSELDVAEISKENKAAEFHIESAVFAGADRHAFCGDSELDKTRKNKEKMDVELNDESGIFTGLERYLLPGDPERHEAGKEVGNTAAKSHDKSALLTSPERVLLSGNSEPEEAGKKGENAAPTFHFTSPERVLLLGNAETEEAGKKGENAAPTFHDESVVSTIAERHPLLADSKLDETGKSEENKAEEMHGESTIFSSPERHLLLRNSELDEGMKGDNTAIKLLDKSASFTSLKRHPLLEDSKPDEDGKCEENKAVELHGDSSIITSPERHLLFGVSGLHETEKKGDSIAAKSHEESAVFTSPKRHLLLGNSESDEAGKYDQNKAMELDNEFLSLTSSQDQLILGVTAVANHDESIIFTSAERHLILGDSGSDEFGNEEERSKADDSTETKGNEVTIKEAEQTTRDLEVEKDQHDNDKYDLRQSQSHCVFSPQVMFTGTSDAILDSRESISIYSNGPILYSHRYDTVKDAASREVLPRDAEVEDFVGLKATQETSNGRQGHVPQVDSVNLADLDGEGADMIMEVETNTCLGSHVFALRTSDLEKGSGEKNSSVGDYSNYLEVGGTKEFGPSIHNPDLINDAGKTLMITGDETDNNRAEELIETTTEEGKLPAEIIHQSEKYKDYEGNLLSDATGSYASEETYVLAGKEDEPSRFDSEESSGNTSKKGGGDSLDGEATVPTVSEKNLPVFALQSEAHDSVLINENNSLAELIVQNNINEQEEKISSKETTPSAQETLARSSKFINEVPDMDGTNTLFERQFSCLTKKGVSMELSLIHGTQVKPTKHDMKENAPNSKIVQTLNVTAPRPLKRQPLRDLRKN